MAGIHPDHIADTDAPAALGPRLIALIRAARGALARHRTPLTIIFAALFCAGVAYSAGRLELAVSDLGFVYIAILALIVIPASMLYGAVNFMIMAHGAGVSVPFSRSFKVSCVAAFAEFLPIPGGALVRGGALMREGTSTLDAGAHVTVNALLWIACSAVAASLALGALVPVALALGIGGVAGVIACTAWLVKRAGPGIAVAALAMRVIGLGLAGARIITAFLAITITVGFFEIYPFVFASILGSAASIAPGGLGISETVAAAIATLSTIPPEAAFLAVGLNRFIGFVVSGIATGLFAVLSRKTGAPS